MRVECWVMTSVPAHPNGCCCGVYKGTTSPHTPQGMLLWGLQRYYLSPHTPRDAAVRFTEVLPLPTHPKGCCCGVYKGTTSPQTHCTSQGCCCGVYKGTTSPHTPQGMLLWGLKGTTSPHTPQGMLLWGLKGTTSPHTPQGMLLWGLQRYYLSPHTPRDAAVGFTKVLPLPTHPLHPKGCCCGVYKGTTSPHTPPTPQGMLLWGLQRYYLSPHTPYTPRDAAVGFTKVLPLPTHPLHPKGCCCGVYKGTTSPHTPRTPQEMLLWGLQRYNFSQTPYSPLTLQ